MYELTVERTFSAAHCLREYDGPCARVHGHNYRVEVCVAGDELQDEGMLVDFSVIKGVCDQVLGEMDHRLLNDLPPFSGMNPTSENIARHIYRSVAQALDGSGLRVGYVRVWETPGSSATYRES